MLEPSAFIDLVFVTVYQSCLLVLCSPANASVYQVMVFVYQVMVFVGDRSTNSTEGNAVEEIVTDIIRSSLITLWLTRNYQLLEPVGICLSAILLALLSRGKPKLW